MVTDRDVYRRTNAVGGYRRAPQHLNLLWSGEMVYLRGELVSAPSIYPKVTLLFLEKEAAPSAWKGEKGIRPHAIVDLEERSISTLRY